MKDMVLVTSRGDVKEESLQRKRTVNIVLYAKDSDILVSMQGIIARLMPKAHTELYRTTEAFAESLRKSIYDSTVAVIIAADKDDLGDLSSLRQLLWGTRMILVLPDATDETVALGHSLRPRFISSRDDGLEYVAAVLSKMLYNGSSK
jgi:hypothetical protein